MTILRIILLALIGAGFIWFLLREIDREHKRQELAKRNMSFIESINLTGLPIITFHNNGNPVNMVLDTGSNVCVINQNVLKDLKYEVAEEYTGIIGIQGEAGEGQTVILPLSYKDYEFDFECYAINMAETVQSMRKEYGVTIHGLLGTGFFTKYKYILDFNSMVAYSIRKN